MPKKQLTIKGVPVTVNAHGHIMVHPSKLAAVLDQGINPLALTDDDRAQNASDAESNLTPFPHRFAERVAALRKN